MFLISTLSLIAVFLFIFQIVTGKMFILKNAKKNYKQISCENFLFSVIIPYYNEDNYNLITTIQSILSNEVNCEIILVNDGSKNPNIKELSNLINSKSIKYIEYSENKGKRFAMIDGFHQANGDFIVFVDSDTVLMSDSLKNACKELIHNEVDAIGGNILIHNKEENFLTKIISGMYWISFNMERMSHSLFKCMTCCSGGFSLYKYESIKQVINELDCQWVLNKKCKSGDDRHLTTLMLMKGFKTIVSINAFAYTITPSKLLSFIKQQQRWTRSFVVEIIWILNQNFKKIVKFYWFIIFKMIFKHIYLLMIFFIIFLYGWSNILVGILTILLIKAVVSIFFPNNSIANIINMFIFGLMGFFIFSPFLLYAVITPFDNKWGTR